MFLFQAVRKAAWAPRPKHYERGFGAMYTMHVTQARAPATAEKRLDPEDGGTNMVHMIVVYSDPSV